MAKFCPVLHLTAFIVALIACLHRGTGVSDEDRKVYIVYMGSLPEEDGYSAHSHHIKILEDVIGEGTGEDYLVRSYRRSFNGLAAKLTEQEWRKMAGMEGVVSAFPSTNLQLHTTRSWDFIGFSMNVKRNPIIESDVIIGVLDTGIWPELGSFSDQGFSPPPKKWKGVCRGGSNFTCNNKIIGARAYSGKARDTIGHGTHTASTAAGNRVSGVSFYGLAQGTTRGAVPSARVAVYAVCQPHSSRIMCRSEDVLAGFDDAIADGVDIITLSLGQESPFELHQDATAIGSFHAFQKGILTVNSAGNNGPVLGTTASVAPWVISVAASSTDRRIINKVVLDDGTTIVGNAINSFPSTGKYPLIYGDESRLCSEEFTTPGSARGMIVLCDHKNGEKGVYKAGAIGAVMQSKNWDSSVVSFPASTLNSQDYDLVKRYTYFTRNPRGQIFRSQVRRDGNAPLVASFSSRGPNVVVPDILKPDLLAPGVEILAAFSPAASPSLIPYDKRSVRYNILSGTSMACPHVAGASAYVKSLHPNWSPSAIKSALMTTAKIVDANKTQEGIFSYGSGLVDPVEAANPGLLYEASVADYIRMLCSMGYKTKQVRQISRDNSTCPRFILRRSSPKDLNYPSMAAKVRAMSPFRISFKRTVTNVGRANSTYKATVLPNPKLTVKVDPNILSFKSLNQKLSFTVRVSGTLPSNSIAYAFSVWSDGTFQVRSPIAVYASDIFV